MHTVDILPFRKALIELQEKMEQIPEDVQKLLEKARIEGVKEGMELNVKQPSKAQFVCDHKSPVWYGEDYAGVVAGCSRKKAAELMEVDEDIIEEIGVGWEPYVRDGELVVDYIVGRYVETKFYGWGYYL